jgi:hypothetical protein
VLHMRNKVLPEVERHQHIISVTALPVVCKACNSWHLEPG